MGDEQNGLALPGEIAHDVHQFVNFLRSQNSRRLVQNEDVVIPVEHFQNLHPLLHTHGNVFHQRVRIHLQAVFFTQRHHLAPGLLLLEKAQLGVFRAQNDVIQHGKHVHQLEMLVNHADVKGVGVVRVVDPDLFAVLLDDALVRLIQTEKHAHERTFSCTVFAQQGVDFSPPQLQRDVIVCLDSRK